MKTFGLAGLLGLLLAGGDAAAHVQAVNPDTQPSFVRLAGGGLAAGSPGLHSYAFYGFGMRRSAVTRAIGDLSGGVSAMGISRNCGARPLAFARFRTLTVYFRNQRFVGWSLAGPRESRPVESEWQIGIGSSRSDLAEADDAAFRPTARGTEFVSDGMHGLMTGRGGRARVAAMWAGVTCRRR